MSYNFEEAVADVIDEQLTPTLDDPGFSRQSSGISGAVCSQVGGKESVRKDAVAQKLFRCSQCPKIYKTLKGYQKHVFLHKINDYNPRKPDVEIVVAASEDFITSILAETKLEFAASPDKIAAVDEVLKAVGSEQWVLFLQAFSEPVCEALSFRTKLLPSNQFEEFLTNYNKFLNSKSEFSKLRVCFRQLFDNTHQPSGNIDLVLSHLCIRYPEEVQMFISKEMIKETVTDQPNLFSSEFNEKAFSTHISNMLRAYYIKGIMLAKINEVWRLRCACIQSTFVCFKDDDECDLNLKRNWTSGNVYPSPNFLSFCKGVERVIKSKLAAKNLNADEFVTDLLNPAHSGICNCWHSLTLEYFSEVDSLVFMRDFVCILLKRSLELEEEMIRGQQEESEKFIKVPVRENLKRN